MIIKVKTLVFCENFMSNGGVHVMLNKEKKNQNIPTENCHFYSFILKSDYCIGVLS